MKTVIIRAFVGVLLALLVLATCMPKSEKEGGPSAESLTVSDSIQVFSDSLFLALKDNYLLRKKVDWEAVKAQYRKAYSDSESFMDAFYGYQSFFDSIGCSHCMIFHDKGFVKGTSRPLLYEDYSYEFGKKHSEGVEFSVSELSGKYGYIEMPGMFHPKLEKDSIDRISQKMYDDIIAIDKDKSIKGWIIDLRFNGGGDAYLMLAALYHFLGDRIVYTGLDAAMNVVNTNVLEGGKFVSGDEIKREIMVRTEPNLEVPIAIIMGNWTASAGEDVILGFTERKNVITIGEPTYGYLTGNDLYPLPFGAQAALTESYMADEHGVYNAFLEPEIKVDEARNNFTDLTQDENIIEAMRFIDEKNIRS